MKVHTHIAFEPSDPLLSISSDRKHVTDYYYYLNDDDVDNYIRCLADMKGEYLLMDLIFTCLTLRKRFDRCRCCVCGCYTR